MICGFFRLFVGGFGLVLVCFFIVVGITDFLIVVSWKCLGNDLFFLFFFLSLVGSASEKKNQNNYHLIPQ